MIFTMQFPYIKKSSVLTDILKYYYVLIWKRGSIFSPRNVLNSFTEKRRFFMMCAILYLRTYLKRDNCIAIISNNCPLLNMQIQNPSKIDFSFLAMSIDQIWNKVQILGLFSRVGSGSGLFLESWIRNQFYSRVGSGSSFTRASDPGFSRVGSGSGFSRWEDPGQLHPGSNPG